MLLSFMTAFPRKDLPFLRFLSLDAKKCSLCVILNLLIGQNFVQDGLFPILSAQSR